VWSASRLKLDPRGRSTPYPKNILSEPILVANDTSVIISGKNVDDFSTMSNTVLSRMSKWFTSNKLVLNLDKINIIKFIKNHDRKI
jgi:hypothetical protein